MSDPRPWMLVAPWYRWKQQGVPATATARDTRPALQKYEDAQFVNRFLEDPRKSLRFASDEDLVQHLEWLPPLPDLRAPQQGRLRRLSGKQLVTSSTRKLYLDTHKRFYLVTCELHCDGPGFPDANRDDVCETGFVVRRIRVLYPEEARMQAAKAFRDVSVASFRLAEVEWFSRREAVAAAGDEKWAKRHRTTLREVPTSAFGSFSEPRPPQATLPEWEKAKGKLEADRERLFLWAAEVGAQLVVEGWVPGQFDGIGAWQPVEDSITTVSEKLSPLYPLIPDPGDRDHAGNRGTIYFGIVPTGGSDAEADGTARFDDHSLYEIRCYVRRHDSRCPKTNAPGDCGGPLTWSRPTERYQLASHFDLKGTSNRPVTIQLPDVPALEAQAASLKPGVGAPVKMVAPPGSSFGFPQDGKVPLPGTGSMSADGQICSFAIPLITLVALFVLNLFLPIVVFVFNLWFLLKLKFCIPPTVQIGAQLAAELAAPGGLDLSTSVDVDLKIGADVSVPNPSAAAIQANFDANVQLQTDLTSAFDTEVGTGAGAELTATYSNNVLARLFADMTDEDSGEEPVSFTAGLEWEPVEDQEEVPIR